MRAVAAAHFSFAIQALIPTSVSASSQMPGQTQTSDIVGLPAVAAKQQRLVGAVGIEPTTSPV